VLLKSACRVKWLQVFFRRGSRRSEQQRPGRRRHVYAQLSVEQLEVRCVLSGQELIRNGAFAGTVLSSDWVTSGNFYADSRFLNFHNSAGYAYLSNADGSAGNSLIGEMSQQFTIPSSATSTLLTYWYNITSQDTGSVAHDILNVTVRNSSGVYLANVGIYSNLSRTSGYQQATFDLSAFKGQTITLDFVGTTDSSLPTVFRIDDVSAIATTTSAPSIGGIAPAQPIVNPARQWISILGAGFTPASTVTVYAGSTAYAIPADRTQYYSPSRIDILAGLTEAASDWSVAVTNSDGGVSIPFSFTVAPQTAPSITSVSPTSFPPSSTNQTLNIYGTNFESGATLTFIPNGGTPIPSTAGKLTWDSAGQITYQFNDGNTSGTWTVQVNSPDGGESNLANITVTTPPVTLTLFVHSGSASGPVLSGAKVTGQYADGTTFSQTTNASGYVTLTGAPGTWSFTATDAGFPTNVWSQSISATETKDAYLLHQVVATAEHLAFMQQPTGPATGNTITPAVAVAIEDSDNNIVTSDDSGVTLTLNPDPATLGGTLTVAAINGVARFSNLTVSAAGTYTLQANDGGDAPVTSQLFSVTGATGTSPRDQLIQALQNFKDAIIAYQQTSIQVFATADVQLAENIANDATLKSLATSIVQDVADEDLNALGELLIGNDTGAAFSLTTSFVAPLLRDLGIDEVTWYSKFMTDWLSSGDLTGQPSVASAENYIQGYLDSNLQPVIDQVNTFLAHPSRAYGVYDRGVA